MSSSPAAQAVTLMSRFAERTGVVSARPPRRYLWTDAFAVCNLLGLARVTGDGRHLETALRLVEQVHRVLGRHRDDDARRGWLSGLDDAAAAAHPTRGGLRIGKPRPERPPGTPPDDRLEWDRDGQYFHYLTKWMHALDRVAHATGQPAFNLWARELAAVAHRAFTYPVPGGGKRMIWKASIDLTRPQVASMGQHDPLDGLVTCVALRARAARLPGAPPEPRLDGAIADFAAMVDVERLATADPLGVGGLLVDAHRVERLARAGAWPGDARFGDALLDAAAVGLRRWAEGPDLRLPAASRLAFRELGLAIGLAAVERMDGAAARALARWADVRAAVVSCWLAPAHRAGRTWLDHEDINEVMLATSLVPDGFLPGGGHSDAAVSVPSP